MEEVESVVGYAEDLAVLLTGLIRRDDERKQKLHYDLHRGAATIN